MPFLANLAKLPGKSKAVLGLSVLVVIVVAFVLLALVCCVWSAPTAIASALSDFAMQSMTRSVAAEAGSTSAVVALLAPLTATVPNVFVWSTSW